MVTPSKFSTLDDYNSPDDEISFHPVPKGSLPPLPRMETRPVARPVPRPVPRPVAHPVAHPVLDANYNFALSGPSDNIQDRRSPSVISVSSDSSGASDAELRKLRDENIRLKIENGNLQGQIAGLTYASSLHLT
jgi:hypothetical protein